MCNTFIRGKMNCFFKQHDTTFFYFTGGYENEKKLILPMFLATALVFGSLTGCGGADKSTSTETEKSSSENASDTEEVSAEPAEEELVEGLTKSEYDKLSPEELIASRC